MEQRRGHLSLLSRQVKHWVLTWLDIGGLETFRVSKSTRETLQPFRACRELAQGTG